MNFSLIQLGGTASENGVTLRDVWILMVIPILVAIVAPLALQTIQYVRQQRGKAAGRKQLALTLQGEIERIRARNVELREVFDVDLRNGEFERKMRDDARYFVYVADGEASHEVFDTKARDFSFIEPECFKSLVEYYDTQSLILKSIIDLKSNIFRELSIPRKIFTIERIVEMLDYNEGVYQSFCDGLSRISKA